MRHGLRALTGIVLLHLTAAATSARDLEVAVPIATTGAAGRDAPAILAAARWAAAAINSAGGIGGRAITIVAHEDPCGTVAGATFARQIGAGRAAAVIGHACAPSALAAAPIYAAAGKPFIAAGAWLGTRRGSGAPARLPGAALSAGRALGLAVAQAATLAEHRVAIVRDKTQSSIQAMGDVSAVLAGGPATVLPVETFDGGDKDFSRLAQKLSRLGVTHVVIGGFASEAGLVAGDLAAAMPDVVMFAGETLAGHDFAQLAGAAAQQVWIVQQSDVQAFVRSHPRAAALVAALAAEGHPPARAAFHTAAALETFAHAARRSLDGTGAIDATAWAAALTAQPVPDTVLGEIRFAADGAGSVPSWSLYRWQGGRLEFKRTIR